MNPPLPFPGGPSPLLLDNPVQQRRLDEALDVLVRAGFIGVIIHVADANGKIFHRVNARSRETVDYLNDRGFKNLHRRLVLDSLKPKGTATPPPAPESAPHPGSKEPGVIPSAASGQSQAASDAAPPPTQSPNQN